MKENKKTSLSISNFEKLLQTVHQLRSPEGCPWDSKQTFQSLRPFLIEEAYEVIDILDQLDSPEKLKQESLKKALIEELGDVLLQILLQSEIADEQNSFNFYDIAKSLDDKLIRRHPHVFNQAEKTSSAEVALQSWEKSKQNERKNSSNPNISLLDGVPSALPSLQKASRIIDKVSQNGFQWKNIQEPLKKVEEEWEELKHEINQNQSDVKKNKERIESELGDVLFSISNLAYHLKINPEDALRSTTKRFEKRFKHVETQIRLNQKNFQDTSHSEMDLYWNEAKLLEKTSIWGLTGGIASGKSTVAQIFSEFNIPVIDADQVTRKLLEEEGKGFSKVFERFGTTDRAALRKMIYQDPQAKIDLEAILHPLIEKETLEQMLQLAPTHSLVIYEAALLIETGRYKKLNGLVVVTSPHDERLKRLIQRDHISPELAAQMIQAQLTDADREPFADFLIDNSQDVIFLKKQIHQFLESIQKLS